MVVNFISNGDPDRIPKVGVQFELAPHVLFRVEGYGVSAEVDDPESPTGKLYRLELVGCLVVPAGSPVSVLESIWGMK